MMRSTQPRGIRSLLHTLISRLFGRQGWSARGVLWGLIGLALAVVVGGMGVAPSIGETPSRAVEDDLQLLGKAPDFTLLERNGRLVNTTDLLGQVWIAGFIFTRCVDVCPLVSRRMAQLQKVFTTEQDVRLVSISVDPAHDTAEVLTRYAKRVGAHPQRWMFLTGDKEVIYRVAREGFRIGVVDPNDRRRSSTVPTLPRAWKTAQRLLQRLEPATAWAHDDTQPQDDMQRLIRHSARLVLVDRQGHIRQYYDSRDAHALRRLQQHVRLLLQERSP